MWWKLGLENKTYSNYKLTLLYKIKLTLKLYIYSITMQTIYSIYICRSRCVMLHVTLWWLSVAQAEALHWRSRGFVERSFCCLWSSQWWGRVRQAALSPAVKGSGASPTGAAWSSAPAQGCRDAVDRSVSSSWAPQSGKCPGWRRALPADTETPDTRPLKRRSLLDGCQEGQQLSSDSALPAHWVCELWQRCSCRCDLTWLQLCDQLQGFRDSLLISKIN